MKKQQHHYHYVPISIFLSLVFVFVILFLIFQMESGLPLSFKKQKNEPFLNVPIKENYIQRGEDQFKKVTSIEDIKEYIKKSDSYGGMYGFGGSLIETTSIDSMTKGLSVPSMTGIGGEMGMAPAIRVSETNVQVFGIDEPDIVKTDGKNIYLSSENHFYGGIMMRSDFRMPDYYKGETKVVNAFPPADLKKISTIKNSGNLLLKDDLLVVLSGNTIYGYDISTPSDPKEKWKVNLQDGTGLVQARLYGDKIYIVTNSNINRNDPCPITPFEVSGEKISIPCGSIYRPEVIVPVNVTYSISTIDLKSGTLFSGISFLGSYDSTVYMSKNSIYVAYAYSSDMIEFFYNFVDENKDIFPNKTVERLAKLKGYDLSENAKMTELQFILEEFRSSLSGDDILVFENEIKNRMKSFFLKHKRDLQKTNIVKIGLEKFNVDAVGTVPGRLLNQFSMDEYEDNLRVAVTVGQQGFWQFGLGGSSESANDLYILDEKMKKSGSVLDMALGENIYSVRFIEDKGYIVTFKQVDPFFVLNLKDPRAPKLEGELKIPGYSAYLHPITKDKILGVGMEGQSVKLSLFDVSDPKNPQEVSKYLLDEYWSDVLNTHRAFLMDKDNSVFFIPGSKGGYVFSYENDTLKLKKAISGVNAKRAVYIDNYLHVIGDDKIIVVSEMDWERVNELKFQ
ncbi:MAG: beta-propeller domain-containing protein [Patescibacteria group bacterium]